MAEPLGNLLRDGDAGGAGIEQQLHRLAVDGTLQTIVAALVGPQQQLAAGSDAWLVAGVKIEGQQAHQREPGQ
ncbi:hypothetical protein HNP10_002804 [Aeromonas veronii]|nr:hypothetical protein [Aeromonas veronii]